MSKRNSFASLHPAVLFAYFAAVIGCSMFFTHPLFQALSLLGAFSYSVLVKGRTGWVFNTLYMLPVLLLMAIWNPLFNHQGVTILFYLDSGNPVTLESVLYGASAAVMFVTVILWFSCVNAVMTSDKIIYLFGRVLPAFSLLFSMVLRFVPRYADKAREISLAQKGIGRDVSQGSWLQRAKNGMRILSILTTWALENAIETADSMKSRGYGLPGRTSFSLFRLDRRDAAMLGGMAILMAIVLTGAALGMNAMRFFPSIRTAEPSVFRTAALVAYLLFCLLPVILTIQEERRWKRIESSI
ncbi:energy-coupling factor transporter transmembrane protein EcfT [Paenibacillus sp. IB182496]|uniref:Energy-coupling factor transporter transmembrane protein EcfT n=1 Tax=Paenibacillus sabuli TaxID=2772509 RepID=A0A927BU35_9BACL|nr:energy-coupling factor transporter transmembrane component T [Paenibacillus sabuli]MBD2846837.1 energy-coupling factor transporter transmembrane protein EcfT [Paenibacillus sabuli]